LSERELEKVAEAEHTRWLNRRLAAGQTSESAVPWQDLASRVRSDVSRHLFSQISQLEDIGFLPAVPVGGPPEAVTLEHTGTVTANQRSGTPRTLPEDQKVTDGPPDWHMPGDVGEPETTTDSESTASHEPADDERPRRAGTFRAWQVTEETVIRSREGKTTANPGDWIVDAADGARWPVPTKHSADASSPGKHRKPSGDSAHDGNRDHTQRSAGTRPTTFAQGRRRLSAPARIYPLADLAAHNILL
jgi:hypothetical protein